jgi:hypothetical protein
VRDVTRPIVSVVTPAGYGKTTLLVQWAERSGQTVAWVSLDEQDNDSKVLLGDVARHWMRCGQWPGRCSRRWPLPPMTAVTSLRTSWPWCGRRACAAAMSSRQGHSQRKLRRASGPGPRCQSILRCTRAGTGGASGMSDPSVKMVPTEREDLCLELRGFEPLTFCMPYKSLSFRNVAGCGSTSSFTRWTLPTVACYCRSLAPVLLPYWPRRPRDDYGGN